MTPFTQYKQWMIERYGNPLFRIPVEIASSCPHGRCAFCSENGSRAQQTQRQDSPREQAEEALRFAKRRYKAKKFMLYIQAFTADLTDPEQQQIILDLLDRFAFTAISIGTRPDGLPEEALEFLEHLASKRRRGFQPRTEEPTNNAHANEAGSLVYGQQPFEVWVELGVQTANDETLKTIHRGHDWKCSRQAILKLAERGIHVASHVILGLPGETSNDWKRTAEEVVKLPISGIKIHNLHVVKGTALAAEYAAAPFPVLSHWEYAEALMDFLRRIPAHIPVMRISTDTPDEQLVAPHWRLEKGQFLDYLIRQMTMREISQGDLRKDGRKEQWNSEKSNIPEVQHSNIPPVTTADGSVTFFSNDWKEHYHTKAGARLEAQKKFVEPSGLKEKLKTQDVRLLDVCFGLGTNSQAAFCAQRADRNVCSTRAAGIPACPCTGRDACATGNLDITALEIDKRIVRAAAEFFQPLESDPVDWRPILSELLQHSVARIQQSTISIRWGDARYLIQHLKNNVFDIVFHDPFSSQHCPELWTVEFFQQLYRVMKPDGVLLTYSSSQPVRGAMLEAGFFIAETVPGQPMGNGTIASPSPLPNTGKAGGMPANQFPAIKTLLHRDAQKDASRSIPYRDPYLCATSKSILRQRQETLEMNAH